MAIPNYGTLSLLDTLSVIDKDNIYDYGEDRLYAHLTDLLNVHNAMTTQMVSLFVEFTTDNIRRFGAGAVSGEMIEVDEWGLTDVQKTQVAGYDIGFPLRAYQYSLGWTRKYFELKAVSDLAKEFVASQEADVRNVKRQMLSALFNPVNYTFTDRLVNFQTLPVKRLTNADGSPIPINEFGATFVGGTHTHYLGRAGGALAAADITAAIDTVVEHGIAGGQVLVLINKAQEPAIAAMTPFTPLQAPMVDLGPGSTVQLVARMSRENPYRLDDRPIGVWDGYVVVHTKPWIPPNYIVIMIVGSTAGKVLTFRTRNVPGYGTLRMVAEHEHYPLRAQHMEREFGVGVWQRLGAAVLYAGGSSYVAPVIP
jgi:hypothetical protein